MRAAIEIIERLRRRRAPVWAALIALGVCQVAVAGHEAAHAQAEAAETCQLCAQLGKNDVPQPVATTFAAHTAPAGEIPVPLESEKQGTHRDTRKARGPPFC